MTDRPEKDRKKTSTSFTTGAIALIFLAIGYQTALFIQKAAVAKIVSDHDRPDTVYVHDSGGDLYGGNFGTDGRTEYVHGTGNGHDSSNSGRQFTDGTSGSRKVHATKYRRKSSTHSDIARKVVQKFGERSYESFPFDPNTATVDDLMRLGFSQKQAQSIENYRNAGGRFRRKEDFAKSFVVADSVYRRLERFIDIPKLDINMADSSSFDSLPGIGAYYASRMVSYRKRLGGYSFPEQLMDIQRFDQERYDKIKDLITLSPPEPYQLWTLPEDSLTRHPYLDRYSAHGIVIFRDNTPRSGWTVDALVHAGILSGEKGEKMLRCRIAGAETETETGE